MKGIVLAGGTGTRLYPATQVVSKQLLPVYDKPMIYYSLSVLMLAGIREIILISTPRDIDSFKRLLGDGAAWGITLSYAEQEEPRGLPEAFIIAEEFINAQPVSMILGDNVFFGQGFSDILKKGTTLTAGAKIFAYAVKDARPYGVVTFDSSGKVLSIEEKPAFPKSHYAVTGLYFYDGQVSELARTLKPSARGELEISELNEIYRQKNQLEVVTLGRGFAWLDTGTHDSLLEASEFIRVVQERQGLYIGSPEEVAFIRGFIDKNQLRELASGIRNAAYSRYLFEMADTI